MGAPYRSQDLDGRKLEPDPGTRRKVHLAGMTTALLGIGIGATAPALGPLAAVFGGGMALLGLALFREAPRSPMRASCPACASEIGGIDPRVEAVRCPSCSDYVRSAGGMLLTMRDDFVAGSPAFAIPIGLGPLPELPPICAECGAADAIVVVEIEVNVPGALLASDHSLRVVQLPHCSAHHRGASAELGAVRVRSHALWLGAKRRFG
jgi:hypothetical protein